MKDMKWIQGFFGFLGFLGTPAITTGDWKEALWFLWFLWFIYFIRKRPANCIFSTISLQVIFAEKSYDKEREGRFNAGYDSQVA